MPKDYFRYTLHVLLVASVGANIFLASRIQKQHDQAQGLARHMNRFKAETTGGERVMLDPAGQTPTVLYVLAMGCKFCELNMEGVKALYSGLHGYRFVAVAVGSKTDLAQYQKKKHIPFELNYVDSQTAADLGFAATTTTYLLSRDGTVLRIWRGAWGPKAHDAIEGAFGVHLPRIPTDSSTAIKNLASEESDKAPRAE